MTRGRCTPFLLLLTGMLLLTGCGGTFSVDLIETSAITMEPTMSADARVAAAVAATLTSRPTVNANATMAAAIAATLAAEPIENVDATVAAAVAATLTAEPTIPSSTPTTVTPTATPEPTKMPTRSPTVSPTPCGLEAHPSLMDAWDRDSLGCASDFASLVWAAWEPFEGGYMLWQSDSSDVYILYHQNATDSSAGSWEIWYLAWDGSNPDGSGMSPPPGLVEPTRGFGWLWRTHLGGPDGRLGWALEQEKGFCARVQPFQSGVIVGSSPVQVCNGQLPGDAPDSSLAPFLCDLYGNGTWECYWNTG